MSKGIEPGIGAMKDYGDMIHNARLEAGLTVRQLERITRAEAENGGVSYAEITFIEKARRPGTLSTAYLLSKALSLNTELVLAAACRARIETAVERERSALLRFSSERGFRCSPK